MASAKVKDNVEEVLKNGVEMDDGFPVPAPKTLVEPESDIDKPVFLRQASLSIMANVLDDGPAKPSRFSRKHSLVDPLRRASSLSAPGSPLTGREVPEINASIFDEADGDIDTPTSKDTTESLGRKVRKSVKRVCFDLSDEEDEQDVDEDQENENADGDDDEEDQGENEDKEGEDDGKSEETDKHNKRKRNQESKNNNDEKNDEDEEDDEDDLVPPRPKSVSRRESWKDSSCGGNWRVF